MNHVHGLPEPPSCPQCIGKHRDYRSDFGHLDMDPTTGATILVQHLRPAEDYRDDAPCVRCGWPLDNPNHRLLPPSPGFHGFLRPVVVR